MGDVGTDFLSGGQSKPAGRLEWHRKEDGVLGIYIPSWNSKMCYIGLLARTLASLDNAPVVQVKRVKRGGVAMHSEFNNSVW